MNEAAVALQSDSPDFDMTDLGARLRQIRVMRKLSLVELSAKAAVSVPMLSHIERGHATPSLNTLQRISMALGVALSDIFLAVERERLSNDNVVVRSSNRVHVDVGIPGLHKELLSPARPSDMEMLILVLAPGSDSGDEDWTGEGEKAGLILSGSMVLKINDAEVTLNVGDSFQFDGTQPHSFRNLYDGETRLVWIIRSDAKS